jgi:hypothetical protein
MKGVTLRSDKYGNNTIILTHQMKFISRERITYLTKTAFMQHYERNWKEQDATHTYKRTQNNA